MEILQNPGPIRDTRYWLRVTTAEDWVFESSVLMDVMEKPHWVSVGSDPQLIQAGESTTLSWEALYVDYVVVEVLPGANQWSNLGIRDIAQMDRLEHSGSMVVSPPSTTTYIFHGVGTEDGRPSKSSWQLVVQVE